MTSKFRSITVKDTKAVLAFFEDVGSYSSEFRDYTTEDIKDQVKVDTSSLNNKGWVCEQEGKIQALLECVFNSQKVFISRLAVSKVALGSGLAKEIMLFAEDYFIKEGWYLAELAVSQDNERAIRFYKRMGYTVKSCSGKQIMYMTKRLSV